MKKPGNQGFSIERKIQDSENYNAWINGELRNWVICQFIKQELNVSIVKIKGWYEGKEKYCPKDVMFKEGVNNISDKILDSYIKYCRKHAETYFKNKFKLENLSKKIFKIRFTSLEQLKAHVLAINPIHICNVDKLETSVFNKDAFDKLCHFKEVSDLKICLLMGSSYSGKTSTMSCFYNHVSKQNLTNCIYLDISSITTVTAFQTLLCFKLVEAFTVVEQRIDLAQLHNMSLIELFDLRKDWILLIDTGDRTIFGNEFERFVVQNDYFTFVTRLTNRSSSNIKVIISEQFSDRKIPNHVEQKVFDIKTEPQNPVQYIRKCYGGEIQSNKETYQRNTFISKSERFTSWNEIQRYIYIDLLKTLTQYNAPKEEYKWLNSNFEKELDINKVLAATIVKNCINHYRELQILILQSLTLIPEGFLWSTFEELIHTFINNSPENLQITIPLNSNFDLQLFFSENPKLEQWLNLYLTENISCKTVIMLRPPLRTILVNGGIGESKDCIKGLLTLLQTMLQNQDKKIIKKLILKSDLSQPEQFLNLHKIVVPGLHAFNLTLMEFKNNEVKSQLVRKATIKKLYNLYDRHIELNKLDRRKNGFALGKTLLSYDVKLQLVSDIIGLNTGPDNGRLITDGSVLLGALNEEKLFYLLESLSVSSIARLRYGSIAKASYLLSSLYYHLKKLTKKTVKITSIEKRCQSRIYQNDLVLKVYFNPASTSNPVEAFSEILFQDIAQLQVNTIVNPSESFYFRRLTKLWIEYALYLLSKNSSDAFTLIYSLSLHVNNKFTKNSLTFENEIGSKFTKSFKHLVQVDKSNFLDDETSTNAHSKRVKKMCSNTYSVTNTIYITQRSLLKIFLDNRKTNNRSPELSEQLESCLHLLEITFSQLLNKASLKYRFGVQDFSSLYSVKTSLLRGKATCIFLLNTQRVLIMKDKEKTLSLIYEMQEKIQSMLKKLDIFDEQALFLKTDSSHLISSSHYLVRECIDRVVCSTQKLALVDIEGIKGQILQRIQQLKRTRELKLTLELEFFLNLIDLLYYFSDETKLASNRIDKAREFRTSLSDFNSRFREQGRYSEVSPIINEVFTYLSTKKTMREKYLTFIIIMFF